MQLEPTPNLKLVGIREALRLPSAVDFRAALFYLPTNFLGSFLYERAVRGGSAITWLKILAVEISILIFIYTCIHFFLRAFAIRKLHILLTLSFFLLIEITGGIITAFLIRSYGIENELHLMVKTFGGMPFVISEMVLIAYLTANFDVHKRLTSSMQLAEANLRYMNANMNSMLEEDSREILNRIHTEIDPQITAIDLKLSELNPDSQREETIETLKKHISSTIKPISRSLNSVTSSEPSVVFPVTVKPKVLDTSIRFSLAETFHPIFWTFVISIMTMTASIATVQTNQLVRMTIQTFISIFIYLKFFQFITQKISLRFWEIFLIDVIIFGSLGPILLGLTELAHVPTANYPQNFAGISFVVGVINGGMAALSTNFKSTHVMYISQLSKTIDALKGAHSQLRQNAWATRKRLGRILHGSLQSTLHAAAINLSTNTNLSAQDIADMRARIKVAIDELETPLQENISFDDRFIELKGIWAGACAISWEISRGARNKIHKNSALAQCIWEIITEVASNASHHGNANTVSYRIDVNNGLLILEARNNGHPWISRNSEGLGTDLYNELSLNWHVTNHNNETILNFVFTAD